MEAWISYLPWDVWGPFLKASMYCGERLLEIAIRCLIEEYTMLFQFLINVVVLGTSDRCGKILVAAESAEVRDGQNLWCFVDLFPKSSAHSTAFECN